MLFRTDFDAGGKKTEGDIRLGLVRRPVNSVWIFLDRLDFIVEKEEGTGINLDSWRIVNNLNTNYHSGKKQLAIQYGLKYVSEEIDGDNYNGFTDLIGIEYRYDIDTRMDIGARGAVLHTWNSSQFDYSTGLSVGFNLLTNTWLSIGYNFLGFQDSDFRLPNLLLQVLS